jgi:hypothetical protein
VRDPAGKRKRQWRSGHDTKREALKALTKLLESLDSGTYVTPSRKTVGEYLTDDWLREAGDSPFGHLGRLQVAGRELRGKDSNLDYLIQRSA